MDTSSATPLTIWVNEQIDPCGIVYSCIACVSKDHAMACHTTFDEQLTAEQKAEGWENRLRTVESWEQVPVNALKLD